MDVDSQFAGMQQLPATSPLDSYSQGQVLGRAVQEGGCTECPSPSDAISTPTSLAPAPGQVYSDEFAQFRLKVRPEVASGWFRPPRLLPQLT